MTHQPPQQGDLILYRTANDAVRVEVLYESETFWLDQKRMADLFGVDVRTVSERLRNIYDSGELSERATLRKIRTVRTEVNRPISWDIAHYNLDAIFTDGYRVNSAQATQFRIWVTQTLRKMNRPARALALYLECVENLAVRRISARPARRIDGWESAT